jgi:hypothetical protein
MEIPVLAIQLIECRGMIMFEHQINGKHIKHYSFILLAGVIVVALLTSSLVCVSDDSDAAESYQARVFIGDGTVNGTIEFSGTGTTLRELLTNAITSNGHMIEFKANGAVSKLDDLETSGTPGSGSYKPLCIYHWVPLKGWDMVLANAEGTTTLQNGTSYYIYKSYAFNNFETGMIEYPGPKTFEPISSGYFFIKMIEDASANDYVKSILTEEQRRVGFWISGEGSDMAEAFYDACKKMRDNGNSGFELDINLKDGDFLKGWLGSFMGLLDVKLNEEEYKYWSQFYWDEEKNDWAYSDCMGYYDPGVMPYFSIIRQITLKDSAVPVGTQYPSDIPAALRNGNDLTISYMGFDGTVAHTESVPYFGSLPAFNLDGVTLTNGDTVEFLGWNVPAGTGFRALSDMQVRPMFDYDITINTASGETVTVDLTESDYLALSISTVTAIKTNASPVEFKVKGGSITLNGNAVSSLEDRSYAVTIASASLNVLPGEIAEELKDSDVFEISLGGQHTFGEGKLSISVNYTVPEGKDVSKMQVYHITDGKKVPVSSTYSDGKLSFETDSLSYFAVSYDAEPEDDTPSSFPWMFVAIGATVVIALAGAAFLIIRRTKG